MWVLAAELRSLHELHVLLTTEPSLQSHSLSLKCASQMLRVCHLGERPLNKKAWYHLFLDDRGIVRTQQMASAGQRLHWMFKFCFSTFFPYMCENLSPLCLIKMAARKDGIPGLLSRETQTAELLA